MPIVYFDGYCNVCNRFIDFLIRHDHSKVLKFAPLQGLTAKKNLPAGMVTDLSTMVFESGGVITTESTAAIQTIAYLGGAYSLVRIFLLTPRFIRDGIYRGIANHRYLFAGRRDTCRVPSAEESNQFLD